MCRCLRSPEEGVQVPGAGVPGDFELPPGGGCCNTRSHPLEAAGSLNSNTPLQPPLQCLIVGCSFQYSLKALL